MIPTVTLSAELTDDEDRLLRWMFSWVDGDAQEMHDHETVLKVEALRRKLFPDDD